MAAVRTISIITFILAAACLRMVPHPPNMTPVIGFALFAGAFLRNKHSALIVPLLTLLISDAVLGFYPHMEVVYFAVAMVTMLGFFLGPKASALRIGIVSVCGSLSFFVITNGGVWAFDDLYPSTLAGLLECYLMGIPFLGNQLVGDLVTTTVLFGGFSLLEKRLASLRVAEPSLAA
jgi:hypothetical protein